MSAIEKYLLEHLVGTDTGHTIESFIASGFKTAVNALLKGDIAGFIAALPADLQAKLLAYAAAQAGTVLPSPVS